MTGNDEPRHASFAEIANLPAPVQDNLVAQSRAVATAAVNRGFTIVFLALIVTTPVLILIGYLLLPIAIVFVTIGLLMCAYFPAMPPTAKGLLARPLQRSWIAREISRRQLRPAQCFSCRYDLRGTPDAATACPECGTAIACVPPKPAMKRSDPGTTKVRFFPPHRFFLI